MMMTSRVMMFFLSIAFASAFKPGNFCYDKITFEFANNYCVVGSDKGLPNRWVASQWKSRVICMMAGTQRIKFKIYPNGRVEETVYGVKGEQCLKVNSQLLFLAFLICSLPGIL